MKGLITSYRRGRHSITQNQIIVKVKDFDTKQKASELLGMKVTWTSPAGKEITGKVSGVHGSKGCVRARFSKGIPGQALGTEVQLHNA